MQLDAIDQRLLDLLRSNARQSATALARRLGVSRSTVQDRIARLEERRVIAGYTIRLGERFAERLIRAHVMIKFEPRRGAAVRRKLDAMPEVEAIHSVSGDYDLILFLAVETTAALEDALLRVREMDGVTATVTAVILSSRLRG
ncbi:MAG: Lrp/AsnC family transcriptional regulator [Kiloniellales bacterium]